ncbi:MAG: flagellin [Candidatus Competibacteraceae bacterium]|nr:flagellin [Candidatus Competibacteraceae bacterium]
MALGINTNIPSMSAQRSLVGSQDKLNTAMQRLTTGMRINSAKDDSAGLAIADRMTAQIKGLNQATRNANDGISLAQTAEGAMQESTNILQRMRELAVQSANDTNSASDRSSLQKEVGQLKEEMNRIANTTSFNGKTLLDGSFTAQKFQVGANANQTINVTVGSARAADIGNRALVSDGTTAKTVSTTAGDNGIATQTLTISGRGSDTVAVTAKDSAAKIAAAVNAKSDTTGVTATARSQVELSGMSAAGTVALDLTSSNSTAVKVSAVVEDPANLTELAKAINDQSGKTGVTAALSATKDKITLVNEQGENIEVKNASAAGGPTIDMAGVDGAGTAGTAATLAVGGSGVVAGTVSFSSDTAYTVSGGSTDLLSAATKSGSLDSVADVDISTQDGSNKALKIIDGALAMIDSSRAELGAVQNRFGSTISNLSNVSENLSGARSRIQDTDFAAETANMSKSQILQQAGIAMLSQANQSQQNVMSLLR